MVKINEYIESGVLESYVLGSASAAEAEELLSLKAKHPEISDALRELEIDLERIAQHMAITPPPGTWGKIEDSVKELIRARETEAYVVAVPPEKDKHKGRRGGQFIEVEAESNQMRVHKVWRWILAAIFILGKIFLGFAIYFYLSSRENEAKIEKLQIELKAQEKHRSN